ncbi:methylated-DNA-[protein]-cysteine S-methyltransferase [Deinobacterium chartae]|uniref:Methylated-DNA--protein-cysteine methyltransferase n=1 Tax=Deinobacterium chartae TaxID=521158 RepID=A0A841HYZ3_9DEIO|nr:methylated-DNA--[protein]-cysteine S-methyltransferase [Deinobacterium chartae]MBB6098761.1 methylated-DNA-[protein]-cysteine S-methyltransferase [Deinobacterium chartae]
MTELLTDLVPSPVGRILIAVEEGRLVLVDFEGNDARIARLLRRRYGQWTFRPAPDPAGFSARFRAYLEGDLHALADLPVSTGGTAFQQTVWQTLRSIPAGQTVSYGELARRLGRPGAFRAVGAANGLNPISIALPCHRVIGADRSLTGFGGGLNRKAWLLQHERNASGQAEPSPDGDQPTLFGL